MWLCWFHCPLGNQWDCHPSHLSVIGFFFIHAYSVNKMNTCDILPMVIEHFRYLNELNHFFYFYGAKAGPKLSQLPKWLLCYKLMWINLLWFKKNNPPPKKNNFHHPTPKWKSIKPQISSIRKNTTINPHPTWIFMNAMFHLKSHTITAWSHHQEIPQKVYFLTHFIWK